MRTQYPLIGHTSCSRHATLPLASA